MKPRSFLPVSTVALLVFGGLLANACVGSRPQPGKTFAVSEDSGAFRGNGSIAALSAEEAALVALDSGAQSAAGTALNNDVPPQFDCLAAGTMIEMANGRSVAIESVHAGDKVFSPYDHADSALAVMDTTKGTEKIPMIRIEDEHGRSLLLTETHAVHLPGRGMVMGKYLKVGDVVTTKSGPSRLVHVSRERFTGTVHNLKVGDSAEIAKLAKDQTAMYANGFLVGDSRIQKANDLAPLGKVGRPSPIMRVPTRQRTDDEHMKSSDR